MTLEYSFGMEEFSEFEPRDARILTAAPESLDAWGSPRDLRFSSVGVMDVARIKTVACDKPRVNSVDESIGGGSPAEP